MSINLRNAKLLVATLDLKFPLSVFFVFVLICVAFAMENYHFSKNESIKCMKHCKSYGLNYVYSPTGAGEGAIASSDSICTCIKANKASPTNIGSNS